MTGHLFQRGHGVFRTHDLHHFNFVELVHADQTAGVATIGTGFRAEARRMGGHFDRQVVFVDDFIAYQVGQRHFRRRDQRVVAAVGFFFQRTSMEQVASEFRQLAGAIQRVLVHQVRDIVFAIAMLFGVQIQHELRQGAVQTGQLAFHHHKTRASQLNGGGKIQPPVHFPQRHVIAHFKIELARRAPAADFNVVVFVTANRHIIMRNIRDRQRDIANFRQQRFQLGLCSIQLFAEFVHFQA